MKKIEKIVVPVDFSKGMDNLVEYAMYMAKSLEATINFVHVISDYPEDAMIGAPYAQEYQDKQSAEASARMAGLLDDSNEVCPGCEGEVVYGSPVDRIVEFAEEKGADLILMGTHGAKGLEKIILGSVAQQVLHKAECPVLVMNPFKTIS
jgi:nucleotide-binding universal stress UspA family protein